MSKAFQFKKAYWTARNELPAGYRRVEYLESTGVQYINTGVKCSVDVGWSVDCMPTERNTGASYCVIGGRKNSGANLYGNGVMIDDTSNHNWRFYYGNYYRGAKAGLNTRVKLSMGGAKCYIDDVMVGTVEYSGDDFGYAYDIYLFALHNVGATGGITAHFKGRVYSGILLVNAIVRNLVPCVRDADSKPGMYDLCGSICPLTGTPFYVNAGTDADFLWGN